VTFYNGALLTFYTLKLRLFREGGEGDREEVAANDRGLVLTFIAVSPTPTFFTLAFAGLMAGSMCTTARLADG
jgi:hypothetical protein